MICRGAPPEDPTTKTSLLLPTGASNAIWLPSGDQLGLPALAPSEVSCIGWEPSLWQTQISLAPERAELKAIRLPSGEKAGELSCRVEEMN